MRTLVLLAAVALLGAAPTAHACGSYPPAAQARIDAAESKELRKLARAAADEADEIFIGAVTDLVRPTPGTIGPGSVSLAVTDTLKGKASTVRTAQWQDRFT